MPDHFRRIWTLIRGAALPPAGTGRIALAYAYGVLCHGLFAVAVLAMIAAMFFGMSRSLGAVPWPWAGIVNALLILQFPAMHSLLLTRWGRTALGWLAPRGEGARLGTTTYATVASVQLILLFAFWTPSGVVWWQAEGLALWLLCGAYAASWLLLIKASWDAGAEVQSGALGWMSMAADKAPRFPPMPTKGTFRLIRHPIYVAFALTLWTVPTWTPDQLAVAITLSAYCLLAPMLKERRLAQRHGAAFEAYKARTPYALPRLRRG
ncbi:MAG: isoprenylcysteine carboxylmethyltransferase family protein [Pseudomonadota bacterium]